MYSLVSLIAVGSILHFASAKMLNHKIDRSIKISAEDKRFHKKMNWILPILWYQFKKKDIFYQKKKLN